MDNWNNDDNYTSYSYGGGVNENLFEENRVSEYSGSFEAPITNKPKSNMKFVVIAIIAMVVMIAAFVIAKVLTYFNEKFDIDDFDKVNSACKEVFERELHYSELNTPYSNEGFTYTIANLGVAASTANNVEYHIYWFEFDSKESADAYFESMDVKYDRIHDEKSAEIGNSNRIATSNKIDWGYTYKNDSSKKSRYFVAKDGKYAVELELTGDADQVEAYYEGFKKKIK